MAFIHQLLDWPAFSWSPDSLAATLSRVRHRQGFHLGKMEGLGFALRAEASVSVLTSDVVKSSAIEGERLDRDEVRSSIAEQLGLYAAGLPGRSRAVEGVVSMALDATRHFDQPLTRERLFRWHAALFPTAQSRLRPITVGAWRAAEVGPMRVASGPVGREKVHFEAPGAERVAPEMDRFLEWFEAESPIDPVLRAGVAHLWFLTIHPFEDGNGRIGRAITDLALCRADGTADRFYSLSSRIASERSDYYSALEAAQRGTLDVTRWLAWFVGCLDRALDDADEAVAAVRRKAEVWRRINRSPVNDRQRKVINRLLDGFVGKLSTSKYARIAKCSPDTALRDIRGLVESGVLIKNPERGRSTSYRLAELGEIMD